MPAESDTLIAIIVEPSSSTTAIEFIYSDGDRAHIEWLDLRDVSLSEREKWIAAIYRRGHPPPIQPALCGLTSKEKANGTR